MNKSKLLILLFLICLLPLSSTPGQFLKRDKGRQVSTVPSVKVSPTQETYDSLDVIKEDVDSLEAAADSINENVSDNSGRIDSLSGVAPDTTEFKAEQANIDNLETAVDTMNPNISDNATDITNLETAVDTMNPNISDNASAISTNVTNITNLQTEIDSTQDTLDIMYQDIDNLEDAADSINENVSDNVTDITNLDAKLWHPADSTLSLDLPYYFNRNVVDIACKTDDYSSWADKRWDDYAAGTHGHDAVNFKTDAEAIFLTGTASVDGIHIDFPDMDFLHFSDGDTCTPANIISFAVFVPAGDSAKLGSDAFTIMFHCDTVPTVANYYYLVITDQQIGDNKWTYFKTTMSAFNGGGGSPNWNNITGLSIYLQDAASAEVTLTFDNFQLIRAIDGEPNPFQTEISDGVWEADWTEEGNGNGWLVEESGRLSVMFPDGNPIYTSYLKSAVAFGDYNISGIMRTNNVTVNSYLPTFSGTSNKSVVLLRTSNTAESYDSTTTSEGTISITYADWADQEIHWRANRRGTVVTPAISLDGVNFVSCVPLHTFTAAQSFILAGYPAQRFYSFGTSAVEYTAEAGVAQRLEGWSFDYTGGLFKIFMPDSILWFTPDSVTANPN